MIRTLGTTLLVVSVASAQELPGSYLDRFQHAYESLEEGRYDEAARLYESCLELASRNATVAYHLACTSAQAGRIEDALMWLGRCVDWGSGDAAVMEWDPYLEPARQDPRFAAVVKKARLAREPARSRAQLRVAFPTHAPALDPTGERLATERPGEEAYLWDLAAGEVIAVLRAPDHRVHGKRFDPSGDHLVTAGVDGGLQVWNGRTGEPLSVLPSAGGSFPKIALSADGSKLFVGRNHASSAWYSFPELEPGVLHLAAAGNGLAVAPDGGRALLLARERAELWDSVTGRRVADLEHLGMPGYSDAARFSRDGRSAFLETQGGVVHWLDASEGTVIRRFESIDDSTICAVDFDAIGNLVVARSDGVVRVWPPEGEAPLRELRVTGELVEPAAFYPADLVRVQARLDGALLRLVTAGRYSPIRLWDLERGALLREWENEGFGVGTDFDRRTGRLVVVDASDAVEVLDARSGETLGRIPSIAPRGFGVRTLGDGDVAGVLVGDGTLRLVDLRTGETQRTLGGELARIDAFEPARRGTRIVADGVDGRASVWDVDSGELVAAFPIDEPSRWAYAPIPDPDGTRLLASTRNTVTAWSVERGERLLELDGFESTFPSGWSPDGRLIVVADGAVVRLFDATTGRPVGSPMTHPGEVHAHAFDRGGQRLATGSEDRIVRVFEVPSGRPVGEAELTLDVFHPEDEVLFVAWLANGDLVATLRGAARAECFDGETLESRWFSEWHGGNNTTIDATPNAKGTRVYVSSISGASVLDARDGAVIAAFERRFHDVAAAPDDRYVVGTSSMGAVVFAGDSLLEERYTRSEWADGGELVHLPNLIHRGSRGVLRDVRILIDGSTLPLDGYAAHLLDPRRVLAGAAGIDVRNPVLPVAPRIEAPVPGRVVHAAGDEHVVTVHASDDSRVMGFQLERDGVVLPIGVPGASVDRSAETATLAWTLERPEGGETRLRIRAIGRSGVLSKPVLVTLRWE